MALGLSWRIQRAELSLLDRFDDELAAGRRRFDRRRRAAGPTGCLEWSTNRDAVGRRRNTNARNCAMVKQGGRARGYSSFRRQRSGYALAPSGRVSVSPGTRRERYCGGRRLFRGAPAAARHSQFSLPSSYPVVWPKRGQRLALAFWHLRAGVLWRMAGSKAPGPPLRAKFHNLCSTEVV